MGEERKIKKVVRKVSFAEAEEADDEFWSKTDVNFRLEELQRLREMIWGKQAGGMIKKVKKYSLYEGEA